MPLLSRVTRCPALRPPSPAGAAVLRASSGERRAQDQSRPHEGAVESFGAWYWENDKDDRDYIKRLAERIDQDGRDPADYGIS